METCKYGLGAGMRKPTAERRQGVLYRAYAELAKEKANFEYDEFKKRISNQLSPVEIDFIENFEKEQKKLRGK